MSINWNEQPLGKIKDAELGRKLGVSRENVRQQRAKRNIPKYNPYDQYLHQKFGQLLIIKVIKEGGQTKFRCKCDCRKEITNIASNVLRGVSRTCGHTHDRINLTGRKFGKLTVIKLGDRKPLSGYQLYWLCKCDCGNEKEILGSNLKLGLIKSCGCLLRRKKG